MMRTPLRLSLALLLLSGALLLAEAPPAGRVRYTSHRVLDDLGYGWSFNEGGAVRFAYPMDDCMAISGNNSGVHSSDPTMTPDGLEIFMKSNGNGVEIERRVRVDQNGSFVRYLDTVRSTSGEGQNIRVVLSLNFSVAMGTLLTDSGAAAGGPSLGPQDCGLLFTSAKDPAASVLVLLAGPSAKVRPSIQNLQDRRYTATYNVRVGPGESVNFAFAVALRGLGAAPEPAAVREAFAPLKSAHLLDDIAVGDRRRLVNFAPASFASAPFATSLTSMVDKLGVERGAADVLALGPETRLRGRASGAALELETERGKVAIPFSNLAAIAGGQRETRVLLRDGQALRGKLTAPSLLFTPTIGAPLPLDPAKLDRLVLRALPEDAAIAGSWGFVETLDGERLAVPSDPAWRASARTAWGSREISQAELLGSEPGNESPLAHRFYLKDGSSFLAFLEGDAVSCNTVLFGRQTFAAPSIRQLAAVPTKPLPVGLGVLLDRPQVLVAGDQILGGRIDAPELHMVTPAGTVPIAVPLIRFLESLRPDGEGGGPRFRATLWDGGSAVGTLQEATVPVRSGPSLLQISPGDLGSVVGGPPAVPAKMADYLRDLGAAEASQRGAASRGLRELGNFARGPLQELREKTTDAALRARVDELLNALD